MVVMEAGLRHRLRRALQQIEAQHRHLKPIYRELVQVVAGRRSGSEREWFAKYADALTAHFDLEEEMVFPAVHGLDAGASREIAMLSRDHSTLLARLKSFEPSLSGPEAGTLLEAFAATLCEHEEREEKLVGSLLQPAADRSG